MFEGAPADGASGLSERLGILGDSITNTYFSSRHDPGPEAALSDEELESLAVRPLCEQAARLAEL